MKRLRFILLFLLLGAIVNVAVAWGIAIWSDQESWIDEVPLEVPAVWPSYLVDLNWPPPYEAIQRRGLGMFGRNYGATIVDISGGDLDARTTRTDRAISRW